MDPRTWCLVVIYIGYWINFIIGFWGSQYSIGPNSPRSELIYLVGMDYEGWIVSRFTFVHKGILEIM